MPLDIFKGAEGARREGAPNENWTPFQLDRNGSGVSKMIQQVKVRQQLHGQIAAIRSVAMAAVTADAGDLGGALIQQDVVALGASAVEL